MVPMIEKPLDLTRGHATRRQRRQRVSPEEADFGCLTAGGRFSSHYLAHKERLVGMKWHGRVPLPGAIEQGQELHRSCAVPRLLEDLAHRGFTGRVVHVGPTARKCPALVRTLLDEQYPVVFEYDSAHIYFGSGM